MGGFPNEGKARRILEAFRSGCETVADVEVELDFAMTRHNIAGHVSNLVKGGRLVRVGTVKYPGTRTAHRYRAVV